MADAASVLPEPVRAHVTDLAATVLGELTEAETPVGLRKVRAFAPARRARSGAAPIAVALDRETAFRHRVAAAWRAVHPELAEAIDEGVLPAAADPFVALAGVHLLRPQGWEQLAEGLRAAIDEHETRERLLRAEAGAHAEVESLRAQIERLTADLAARAAQVAALEEELAGVRRELRRHRSDADRARAAARESDVRAAAALAQAQQAGEALTQTQETAAAAVQQAQDATERARRVAREGRSLDDARLRLLLDTVVEAAGGLRRELALPPVQVRPGDVVAAEAGLTTDGTSGVAAVPGRGLPADDPGLLAELLALPQVHLVVDGYNVTKSAYPSLTLAEQRRRLVDGLVVLAARTSSEVTCCFDGAEVDAAPASRVRGVRVLFSPAGTTADDLVRRLVRAEPAGRPVVVVSSDAEVVSGVRAAGARAVPSVALARLLARG